MDGKGIDLDSIFDALDSLTEGFVVYDEFGCLVCCNRAFREFYGYSEEECVTGVHFRELGQLDVERETVLLKGIAKEEYVSRRDRFRQAPLKEFLVYLSDGRVLQTRDQRTDKGGVVSVQTDVTELHVKNDALSRATARLSTLLLRSGDQEIVCGDEDPSARDQYAMVDQMLGRVFRTMPAVAYSVSLRTREVIFVSPNVFNVTGYYPEEVLSIENWWLDGLHPEDRDNCTSVLAVLDSNPQFIDHEYRFRHKSGHYIRVHDQFYVERDSIGQPDRIIGSWLDITSTVEMRKKAALVGSMDRLNIGVISIDNDGHVLIANRRGSEILAAKDGLALDHRNRLIAMQAKEDKRLNQILGGLVNEQDEAKKPVAISISRRSGLHDYSVVAVPAPMVPIRFNNKDHRTIVFISDPEWRVESSVRVLSDLYGLTVSEGRVTAALVAGDTIKEVAQRLSLTEGTVRQYVKTVFDKTNTKSQVDLVRRILIGPASLWLDHYSSHSRSDLADSLDTLNV